MDLSHKRTQLALALHGAKPIPNPHTYTEASYTSAWDSWNQCINLTARHLYASPKAYARFQDICRMGERASSIRVDIRKGANATEINYPLEAQRYEEWLEGTE